MKVYDEQSLFQRLFLLSDARIIFTHKSLKFEIFIADFTIVPYRAQFPSSAFYGQGNTFRRILRSAINGQFISFLLKLHIAGSTRVCSACIYVSIIYCMML